MNLPKTSIGKPNRPDKGQSQAGKVPLFRGILHKFIPANFNNILDLTWRLLFEGKPAGRMAIVYSLFGVLLSPLDIFLQLFERRLYRKAGQPQLPQIFVCGAPRSGTTVTAQVLIKYLPVFYFNNFTSLFPRSPVTALKLFGWLVRGANEDLNFMSFYGRTTKLFQPNDALYFWDRWAGEDRRTIPNHLDPKNREAMVKFFGAVEEHSKKTLVNKNNSLNTYAHLVANAIPNAYFICLDRDPVFLAQSHYRARKFIHGDERVAYGIRGHIPKTKDPIEDICRQVLFHKNQIRKEQQLIGKDRFMILRYEDFCARPAYWVKVIGEKILNHQVDLNKLRDELKPFEIANRIKIDVATFHKIEQTLKKQQNKAAY